MYVFAAQLFGPKTQSNRKQLNICQESDDIFKGRGWSTFIASIHLNNIYIYIYIFLIFPVRKCSHSVHQLYIT